MKNNIIYLTATIIVLGLFSHGCEMVEYSQIEFFEPDHPGASTIENSAIVDDTFEGNMHFFFLPPLVPDFETFGKFNSSLLPEVDIINLSDRSIIEKYSMLTGSDGGTIHIVHEEQYYLVNWCIDQCKLEQGSIYRVRVRAGQGQTELGHVDIKVIGTAKDLLNESTNTFVPLLGTNVVPIKFRIERGS